MSLESVIPHFRLMFPYFTRPGIFLGVGYSSLSLYSMGSEVMSGIVASLNSAWATLSISTMNRLFLNGSFLFAILVTYS
ncbi:hypothetical protein [Nitrosopumilus sp.]|uniref:hypothetical protein n=1 Tax=Nitrosopumilus sp. TaxID=2024843 RepID=UPI00292CEEDF|nr:hypothetical protein [Nitrosopumilus sp.]